MNKFNQKIALDELKILTDRETHRRTSGSSPQSTSNKRRPGSQPSRTILRNLFPAEFPGIAVSRSGNLFEKLFKNCLPAPAIEPLWVKTMPLVLELGKILLLPPPPRQVTKREHSKREGTRLETRKVTSEAMFDF